MIFDTTQISHKNFNHNIGDDIHHNDRGFYKQYYRLLYHLFLKLGKDTSFYCYLDEKGSKKTSSICIQDLRYYLKQRTGDRIRVLESHDSKSLGCLQLADLLVGSVALDANDRSSRLEKIELVNFIRTQKNLSQLSMTSYHRNFKVWRFDYSKSKKVPVG